MVIFAGVATAAPAKIKERAEYSASLNSIASITMTWYGSLINASKTDEPKVHFDTQYTAALWAKYRSHYPKKITQIVITSTDLLKQDNDYYFTVNSDISFMKNNQKYTHSFKELFIIQSSLLKQATQLSPPIKDIQLIDRKVISVSSRVGYNRMHYKVREFIYAWLSHLDGIDSLDSVMNADAWLDSATYSLEIGADKSIGAIASALKKRKLLLAKGGHLLRSLKLKNPLKTSDTKSHFTLELIIEWRGENKEGTPVIAKIKQILEIHINANKAWKVISIKEKHLLPSISPWMGLLC